MYVCLCRGINEHTVCSTVAAGARSLEELVSLCGAGSGCGGCLPSLRLLLDSLNRPADPKTEAEAAAAAAGQRDHSGAPPGMRPQAPMLRPGGQPCEAATASPRCSTRS